MKKIILIFFILNFTNYSFASGKTEIINNFKKINNISFDFKQKINNKTEEGKCIIKYPKKIYCDYENIKKKIIVSNGKSLVIKNRAGKEYFIYPLERTSLELILNKDLLINKISKLEAKLVDEKYFIITIIVFAKNFFWVRYYTFSFFKFFSNFLNKIKFHTFR